MFRILCLRWETRSNDSWSNLWRAPSTLTTNKSLYLSLLRKQMNKKCSFHLFIGICCSLWLQEQTHSRVVCVWRILYCIGSNIKNSANYNCILCSTKTQNANNNNNNKINELYALFPRITKKHTALWHATHSTCDKNVHKNASIKYFRISIHI